MLEIKSFVFGPFQTNTYVVSDGHHVLLIDPACSNQYEQHQLYQYINSQFSIANSQLSILNSQLSILNSQFSIIATHGHLDHLWGANWATEQWHTPVLMHEADIPMATAMQSQYELFGIPMKAEPFEKENIQPEIIHIQSQMGNFELLETPGHTRGSICLYFPEEKTLFSGDTLFRMGYGRTDLPGGNMGQLINSLDRLFELPPDVRVYPGHGDPTTIGAERR